MLSGLSPLFAHVRAQARKKLNFQWQTRLGNGQNFRICVAGLEMDFRVPKCWPKCYHKCDDCGRERIQISQWEVVFADTECPVSLFLNTDFWQRPRCLTCVQKWLLKRHENMARRLLTATVALQRWWRRLLYLPPHATRPQGGLWFVQARQSFVDHADELGTYVPDNNP